MAPPTTLAALRGIGLLFAAPPRTVAAFRSVGSTGPGPTSPPSPPERPHRAASIRLLATRRAEDYLAPTLETARAEAGGRVRRALSSPPDARGGDGPLLVDGLLASRVPPPSRIHQPIVNHEHYSCPDWPSGHTFPMRKFELTASSLLHEPDHSLDGGAPLVSSSSDFHRPIPASSFPRCLLSPPICPDFADRFLAGRLTDEECRVVGFREQTSRPELIERTVLEVAGTVLTAQLALRHGMASNVAGGTHHATRDKARGYTILNDLATAARLMTWDEDEDDGTSPEEADLLRGLYRGDGGPVERVLVVDTDVHQGDGTATFHNGPESPLRGRLFTLDLHASRNYPARKVECTYSVGLPDGTDDDGYLDALAEGLDRAIDEVRPHLVLYNAGVDVYEHDKLGRLNLTMDGIRRRDMHVVRTCRDAGLPVACTVGGGYSDDPGEVAGRHAIVHRVCAEVWREGA